MVVIVQICFFTHVDLSALLKDLMGLGLRVHQDALQMHHLCNEMSTTSKINNGLIN